MSATITRQLTTDAYGTDADRWAAVVARDKAADGVFVFAVRTTGVYCRPGCPSRTPRRENVRFFHSSIEAERAGFRACRRCRPREDSPELRRSELVTRACRAIEAADKPPVLSELARSSGLSASRFHRVFKSETGVTPRAYAAAVRAGRVRAQLDASATVTDALWRSGFESTGRFYESAAERLGMTPTEFRAGGSGTRIQFAVGECWLGAILVAATERGVCAILLGDDPEELLRDLQDRFPQAELIGGDSQFERTVAAVVGLIEQPAGGLDLPLDVRGTAFQQQVWEALRKIPPGTTVTYSEIAEKLGRPTAVRAVATACAANPLAVAIPCHRVVRRDGAPAGYRWGIDRKRSLLEREQHTD